MIYLDYNATTPVDKRVADAMMPYLYEEFGNPSSSHEAGRRAAKAVRTAREQTASLLGCDPDEIVFTSCGSESNNMVLKGVSPTPGKPVGHIVTSRIEHPAVLKPCAYLEAKGWTVDYAEPEEDGIVKPESVRKLLRPDTVIVSLMHSNNETGALQPVKEIAALCRERGILIHSDASQSLGKVPVDVKVLDVDFLTVAGHKLYAPKGIGTLYIRRGLGLESLIHGAGHESGRRAGTENVPYVVAMGKACELAGDVEEMRRLSTLRDYFQGELERLFDKNVVINGHRELRLPNTLNISFLKADASQLITELGDVAVSTGSACHSGETRISPVLAAMGIEGPRGRGAIRFSLGRFTEKSELDIVIARLSSCKCLTAG